MNLLLYLLVVTSVSPVSAVVYRSYIDSNVSAITSSDRFHTENSTVCEETCESKQCDAYNFNPTKSNCQLIQLISPAKKPFTCSRPVPVKVAGCSFQLATTDELCHECERVTISNTGEGVRASCGDSRSIVYMRRPRSVLTIWKGSSLKESTELKIASFLECNLTSAGWNYGGEYAGATIKMGCSKLIMCRLKSVHGSWLQPAKRGKGSLDVAMGTAPVDAFFVEEATGGVVLRSPFDYYLSAREDFTVGHARSDKTERETWKAWRNDNDGSWSLQSLDGRWLSAKVNGSVRTEAWKNTDEMFWIELF